MATHREAGGLTFERSNLVETSAYYHNLPSYNMAEETRHSNTHSSNYGHSSLTTPAHRNEYIDTHSAPPSLADSRRSGSPRSSRLNSIQSYNGESRSDPSSLIYQNLPPSKSSYIDGPTSIHSAPQSYVTPQGHNVAQHALVERVPTSSNIALGLIPRSAPSSLESYKKPPVNSGPSALVSHQYAQGSVQGSAYYQPPSGGQRLSPKTSPPTTHSSAPVPAPRHRQQNPTQQPTQTLPVPKPRTRLGSSDINQAPSTSRGNVRVENLSAATLENARYSLEHFHTSDHPNEDRHFIVDMGYFQVFAVFDGHDGERAAQLASTYMEQLFKSQSWGSVVRQGEYIPDALMEFFRTTEKEFFGSIRSYIDERNRLQARIPQHLKSYEAYQRYPTEVKRLQEIEPHISGGCTAVVAVIANNKLYVANVGDSRAVLIFERPNGTLAARQLSVDHGVENEEEVKRLASLGLNIGQILSSGRLGTQDNTRSIGDFNIKEGYKNVDVLSSARAPPGIAEPYMMPAVELRSSLRYLVLMSDGVYKSIEGIFDNKESIEANKVLLNMIDQTIQKERTFTTVSDGVLDRLQKIHKDTYEKNARIDPRSPLANACRKRDDMTLIVYKFSS